MSVMAMLFVIESAVTAPRCGQVRLSTVWVLDDVPAVGGTGVLVAVGSTGVFVGGI